MKFINLDSNDDNLEVKSKVAPKKIILDRELEIPVIGQTPKEDSDDFEEEAAGVCGIEQYYGDPDEKGFFLKDNLFSELVSSYQRAQARFNLGIGEEYALVWGNITGSITDQTDLNEFLWDFVLRYSEEHNLEINEALALFVLEVNSLLDGMVGIDSPNFTGKPTAPTPEIGDNSDRLATTAWVNRKLRNQGNLLKYISLDKDFMFTDQPPKTVKLSWEFHVDVDKITIDGIEVPTNTTEYIYTNVNESFFIVFTYEVNNTTYNEVLVFEVVDPIYMGRDPDMSSMTMVEKSELLVVLEEKEFVYLYIPGDKNARLSVDNLYGGFIRPGARDLSGNPVNSVVNAHGRTYYLYQSVNSGLGEIQIKYE